MFAHDNAPICKFNIICERNLCMFKHVENVTVEEETEHESDNVEIVAICEDECEEELVMIEGAQETLEFNIFVPCRDHFLTKDQQYYSQHLNGMPEIGKLQELWIKPNNEYKVGTYLETTLKFTTKYATMWKESESFRMKVWNRLNIKETCPE